MLEFSFSKERFTALEQAFEKHCVEIVILFLATVSACAYLAFYYNGLGISYNDARSHLDIGRRVVEGLKPGFAQLGSVWLPLPHVLMLPTIWNDFMWHSGLSGSLESMVSFVITGVLIYLFLKALGVGLLGRIFGVVVFAANLNVLYMQSTAMTELLLLATMTGGVYELMLWLRGQKIFDLVKASFFIMLSTLIRYDGWFLFVFSGGIIVFYLLRKKGYKMAEGVVILFSALAGFGILLWLLWNQLIFKDALYFIFGPYSARAQQAQLESAGVLATKGNLLFSLKIYFYALAYNSGAFTLLLGMLGGVLLWFDKRISGGVKLATSALFAPLLFNVLALYLGHSVLFVQGLSGNSLFNVRYGLMMLPSIAIFMGYLIERASKLKFIIMGLFFFVTFFSFANIDAVTVDDARVGSSQKNVSEVSGWLMQNAMGRPGFVLISAASHDAIIFSSGLPMKQFIHEGTGLYWESATVAPDRWARWIVMRTNDTNDMTFKLVGKTSGFKKYKLVGSYPFADIYEIKEEYVSQLNTEPILGKQK